MKEEACEARNEVETLNTKIKILNKETETAVIASEEAEKRLEIVTREVKEAKDAEERVKEEMKLISKKQESKKRDDQESS
ncbi:unnamed protein product [Cochlearia groenlandica]